MFFKKDINNKSEDLIKICALLIHAAKIDEKYSQEEEEIIKKTLLDLGADKNNLETLINKAKKIEENANQILDFTGGNLNVKCKERKFKRGRKRGRV